MSLTQLHKCFAECSSSAIVDWLVHVHLLLYTQPVSLCPRQPRFKSWSRHQYKVVSWFWTDLLIVNKVPNTNNNAKTDMQIYIISAGILIFIYIDIYDFINIQFLTVNVEKIVSIFSRVRLIYSAIVIYACHKYIL